MAYEEGLQPTTLPASADLSADQYRFVIENSSGQAALPATAGIAVFGVLQNKPSALGQACQIAKVGSLTKMITGTGGLTAGDKVATDNVGKAVTATTGQQILGYCTLSAAAGHYATVMFQPEGAAP